MVTLLAQLQGLSIVNIAIAVVVIAGLVALVYIALRALGIKLPDWFVQVLLVILVVVVVVIAIKFIASIW